MIDPLCKICGRRHRIGKAHIWDKTETIVNKVKVNLLSPNRDISPNKSPNIIKVSPNNHYQANKKWRATHSVEYRAYMREYMRGMRDNQTTPSPTKLS